MQKKIAALLCTLYVGGAAAQDAPRPATADATKPGGAPSYESAFRDYRRYVDPELARWREANDEVGRLNGHVGHVPRSAPAVTPGAAKPQASGVRK